MLEGINYRHAKFQINILKNKKIIKLLELWTLWLKKKKKEKNSEYKRVVITTLKRGSFLYKSCGLATATPLPCCGVYQL